METKKELRAIFKKRREAIENKEEKKRQNAKFGHF